MTLRMAFVLMALVLGTCARTQRSALEQAADAMGGADRLRALNSFVLHGTGSAPNAGQNRMPDDELPVWKINEYVRTVDLANGRSRRRRTTGPRGSCCRSRCSC